MPVTIHALADLPSELARQFADGNGVLWTGAGVSARRRERSDDGTESSVGVPGAWALMQHFRKRLGASLPDPETLETLSMVYTSRFGREKLDRLLRRLYGTTLAKSPRFYSLISQLPSAVRSFVTTNYDPFLERALAARDPVVIIREHGIGVIAQQRPHVYKVHGDGMTPRECVISTRDYTEWERTNRLLIARVAQFFFQQAVVAIGYRAQDGHFLRLLDAITSELAHNGQTVPRIIVVIPEPRIEDFAQFSAADTANLILVPATGDEFLHWLLARLAEETNRRQAVALSALIDPPTVRAARASVEAATSAMQAVGTNDSASAPLLEALAEARLQLGEMLAQEGRIREALREQGHAASLLRTAERVERADNVTAGAARVALERCLDAELASSIIQTGTTHLTYQETRPPFSPELQRWSTRADILSGEPEIPTTYLQSLETIAAEAARGEQAILLAEHASLSASAAINVNEYTVAAAHYQRLGEAGDERAQVLRWLCHGLAGMPMDALRELQRFETSAELWPFQLRAIGWIAGLAGEYDLGRDAFLRSARLSAESANADEAVIAFWGAAWAGTLSPRTWFQPDPPGMVAYRLQERTRMQDPNRQWSDRLLERAELKRAARKLNEAWRLGLQAWRLSHELLDPRGVSEARRSVALTLLETAAIESDEPTWFWLIHWLAYERAQLEEHDAHTVQERLRQGLTDPAHALYRIGALVHASANAVSPSELRSTLILLTDVADLLPATVVERVCLPLIRRALPFAWTTFSALDLRTSSCELIPGIASRIPQAAKLELLAWAREELRNVPQVRRTALLGAAVALIEAAGNSPEIWSGWGEPLLWALEHGMGSYNEGAVRDALSRFLRHAPPVERGPVVDALRTKGEAGDWACVDCLVAGEVDVPTNLLDAYLDVLIERASPYRRPPEHSLNFGLPLESSLLCRASRANPERFEKAVEVIADVLQQPGQWSGTRLEWFTTLFLLLMNAPRALEPILPVVLAQAERVHANGAFPPTSNHTLSMFRMDFGSPEDVQLVAIQVLGYALGGVDLAARTEILALVSRMSTSPDMRVRTLAVDLCGIHWHRQRVMKRWLPEEAEHALHNVALQAIIDPDDGVSAAARKALRIRAGIPPVPDSGM